MVNAQGIISGQDIQAFIESRNVGPEDFYIIESLARYPKLSLTVFHDFFIDYKDRAGEVLQTSIYTWQKELDDDIHNDLLRERIEIANWYLEIFRKYDWYTANHLNRVLERLNLSS